MKTDYFSQFPHAHLVSKDGTASFKICTYNYAYPEADNIYDADWHRNYLIFTLPAFKAEIDEIMLEGNLLTYYIEELRAFTALKINEVFFEPTEPYFGLTFSFLSKRKKRIGVEGYVQYPVGIGAVLQFEFETGVTDVVRFINGLEDILAAFPAIKEGEDSD
ncbi:hypothetical protein DCC39_13715 [Pueribacillus theae]|uniref:Uncharacterized protein n=1 Tax=Pueribacillus theae TaxID=2171751 RepID=A0A2U1JUY8_9BACI|nr:hypothetical protein [Pueribacillus theae]PWA09020.1 hypothetical protein DCC39_13715 [Pueribacillus theae]